MGIMMSPERLYGGSEQKTEWSEDWTCGKKITRVGGDNFFESFEFRENFCCDF